MLKYFLVVLILYGVFLQHASSRHRHHSNQQQQQQQRRYHGDDDEDTAVYDSKFHVDYFVLAVEWPQGTCEYMNATGRHVCVVPDTVEGWTLHGLWPSIKGHRHLQFCNSSAKFNYDKIKYMEKKLLKYWPNLFAKASRYFLWKHEYIKHGTCAALVKGFETEEKYFSWAMDLLEKYHPLKKLQAGGIVPRADPYSSASFTSALTSAYGGVDVCGQCSYYGGGEVKVISGLEICLTKGLELMNCPQCGGKYRCHGDVYYHPLHFKN